VRVNGLGTGLMDADLEAIVPARPDAIMLPKAEGGAAIVHADAKLGAHEAINGLPDGHIKIVAMAIESAAGLFLAGTFRRRSARLVGLSWGAEDLAAELGAETNRDSEGRYTSPYLLARTLCLMAAAAAEVPAIETIYMDYRNAQGLRRDTEDARRDGFAGRLAIHPLQVPIINEVFTPSAGALAQARAIVAAFDASPGAGVIGIEGVMYDRPHLVRAQRLIARAKGTAADG
jgi:citrate lyase subunit beta/citryl-CoA lyase